MEDQPSVALEIRQGGRQYTMAASIIDLKRKLMFTGFGIALTIIVATVGYAITQTGFGDESPVYLLSLTAAAIAVGVTIAYLKILHQLQLFAKTTLAIDAGYVVVRRHDGREVLQIDLEDVGSAKVGNAQYPDDLRMHLHNRAGECIAIIAVEDMEAFIAEATPFMSIPIERINETLPLQTHASNVRRWVNIAIVLGVVILFFIMTNSLDQKEPDSGREAPGATR